MPLGQRAIAALSLAVLTLTGCGTTQVGLQSEFPEPVIERLPLQVGLYFEEGFSEYRHEETLEDYGSWSIALGASQSELFRHMSGAMFSGLEEVDSTAGHEGLDAVLAVALEDFQFSVPRQNRGDFYEVWIRYRMRLHGDDGEVIAEWPLTGYGKASEQDHSFLSNRSRNVMREATMLALRDAGAFLTLGFRNVRGVRSWLEARMTGDEEGRNASMAESEEAL